MFSFVNAIGQTSQTISINNSLIAISIEANIINSHISTDGDSQYYSLKKYSNGGGYKIGYGGGFSVGTNFEVNLTKNSRNFFILTGLFYIKHSAPLFKTQGGSDPNDPLSIFWTYYPRTSDPEVDLRIHSLRIPVAFNLYVYTFGRMKKQSVGFQMGCHFDYLLNAKIDGQPANDLIRKIYITGFFAGAKYRYGKFYAHMDFSIMASENLFTKKYATYGDSGGNYKESFSTIGLGYYIKK